MIDSEDIIKGRRRDGDAAQDRSDDVEEILSEKERVGHGVEKPLLEREYDDYPSRDDLFRPQNSDLEKLVQHDYVNSTKGIANELNVSVDAVEKAANIHGIDLPSGGSFDVDVEVSRLDQLIGDELPSKMVEPDNPVCLTILYLGYGFSIDEIVKVFNEEYDNRKVRAKHVRQKLVDCHVLKGKTTQELENQRRRSRGEVNRTTNGGINIDTREL